MSKALSGPVVPRRATVRLARVTPGCGVRLDAFGRVVPVGHRVTNPSAVVPAEVTFTTPALASAGSPVMPAIDSVSDSPAPNGVDFTPVGSRVSSRRVGTTGV